MKIGIRAHDLDFAPYSTPCELVRELKNNNIEYIQLVFKKAFKDFEFNNERISDIASILKSNNIKVAMIGAYFNMIHPDIIKLDKETCYFKKNLDILELFDCKYVGTETGSYNGDKWTFNPLNHTIDAYNLVKTKALELQEYASHIKKDIILEGAFNHVIYEPKYLYQLLNECDLKYCTLDLFNYLNISNYLDHTKIFDQAIELLKDKIQVIHMKDFIIENDKLVQVGLGEGLMNYNYIIPKIKKYFPDAYLILEGITKDRIKKSVNYLRSFEND